MTPPPSRMCGCNHEGVDGHDGARPGGRQEVTGDACDASSGGDDLGESSGQHGVDRLVVPVASMQLHQNR